MSDDLRTAEFRLALMRVTRYYPPDTIAGRLAADALAKHPNRYENIDRENDSEPFEVAAIKGLPHGPSSNEALLREALADAREGLIVMLVASDVLAHHFKIDPDREMDSDSPYRKAKAALAKIDAVLNTVDEPPGTGGISGSREPSPEGLGPAGFDPGRKP